MTTIQVSERLRRRLAALKGHSRETYEDVIRSLLSRGSRPPLRPKDANMWEAVAEFKKAVQGLYGDRFDRLVVFGSLARGDTTDDSDIDVLLVLHGEVDASREIDRIADEKYAIDLRRGTLLSVIPISLSDFIARTSPLLLNVRREGVPA